MKKFAPLFLLLAFASCFCANAQILETVSMSTTSNYSTYLTGINNSGYVTGYYNNGFFNVGFIITPTGKKLEITPSQVGNLTDSKVDGINDNGVAVVTANTGTTVGVYRCYLDTLGDSIHHLVQVTGLVQPSSVAFDINNNNDIAGWFQSANRYLWVKHDSIIPGGNIAFESSVFETAGPTYYNTMAGGVNDANKVAGFYIDGSNYEPFLYNNLTEVYDLLGITNKCKLWDVNNNNWVAGEFLQLNNIWMAFIANASTGNFTQFTSLKTIFDDSTIQSVANGINDQGEVVGSFLHPDPNVNVWVGFIYHPGTEELRIPGFAYNTGTWKLNNNSGVANTVWPSSYWGAFDYDVSDPYVNNGTPLIDAFLQNANPGLDIAADSSVDWLTFAKETDVYQLEGTTDPFLQTLYHSSVKHVLFDKYKTRVKKYNGHCYGFTYTQLLHHFDEQLFETWFDIPTGTNISQVNNTDDLAIQAIARSYFRQNDIPTLAKYSTGNCFNNETMWSGLHEMKMEFKKPINLSNPRSMSFGVTGGGYHSILPYKIHTPRTLPFDYPTVEGDTVWVHDSNFPLDSSRCVALASFGYNQAHSNVAYPGMAFVSMNKISIRELMGISMTELKSTSAGDDPMLTIATDGPSYYDITTTGGQSISNGAGYTNNSPELLGLEYETQIADAPVGHLMDTANTAAIHTYNYLNNAMIWKQTNKLYSMGISRTAVTSEADNGEMEIRRISYGNPDATTKYLTCYLSEIDPSMNQGVSIMATNVCADQGDSIVTSSPSNYVYQIAKVNGSATCTYTLTVFAAYNGTTVNEFSAPVVLSGTTTHTIDPYFVGLNGVQIAVIVDNGNDGTTDDTLFIAGFPVDMKNTISKGGIKVYPNPVRDELNVEFATAGKYSIIITDVVGRTISNNTMSVSAGRTVLPMDQYPNGVYLIQVTDEKGRSLLKDKIIKQ